MSKQDVLNKFSRTFHKVGFELKKHSPAILVGVGIVGVVASTVMACKATTKVKDILDETKHEVEQIHECMENEELITTGQYSEQDGKKDLAIVYTKTGLKFAKLYGPSVALGALSIGSILASHHILNQRNISIAAAYAVVDNNFKDYRKRVVDRFGEKIDKELKYNIKAKQVEVEEVDETTGEVKKKVEVVEVADINAHDYSEHAKCFDAISPYWVKDPEMNLVFLKQTQSWANDKLRAKGHLFLNEVYEMLGFPETKAGAVTGWIYDEKNPVGDNFVDFGLYDIHKRSSRDFVNGYERCVWLDFNIDGVILNHLA